MNEKTKTDFKWIEFPEEVDKTKVTINEELNLISFVKFYQDGDCPNPLTDSDGMGLIHSLSRNHNNSINLADFEAMRENPDCVVLSYFEHGQCLWDVQDGEHISRCPDMQWDGVKTAGIWVPDACCVENIPPEIKDNSELRRDWMVKQASLACEEYTAWCNGECYGYEISVYPLRKHENGEVFDKESDYRKDDPVEEDSCWGFIGWDYFLQSAKESLGV